MFEFLFLPIVRVSKRVPFSMILTWLWSILGREFYYLATSYMEVEWLYSTIESLNILEPKGTGILEQHINNQATNWLTNADHSMTYVRELQKMYDSNGIAFIRGCVIACKNCGKITMKKYKRVCYDCWATTMRSHISLEEYCYLNIISDFVCKRCRNTNLDELRTQYSLSCNNYECIGACEYQCIICEKRHVRLNILTLIWMQCTGNFHSVGRESITADTTSVYITACKPCAYRYLIS